MSAACKNGEEELRKEHSSIDLSGSPSTIATGSSTQEGVESVRGGQDSDDLGEDHSPYSSKNLHIDLSKVQPQGMDTTPETDGSRMRVLPVRVDMIKCGYQPKTGIKQPLILQDVNTCFESGQLVAVMGPSGSGKSTLLKMVHGDRRYLKGMTGNVLVNGTPIKTIHDSWRQLCSLVPQDDVLFTSFTVNETMMFSTHLRLSPDISLAQKEEIVASVLEDLGLVDCADTVASKVSGGQRRRVSIGLELVVNPSVLLLDEPTSGLDSKTAEDICSLLWLLAKPGRLVICSIHQPSYKLLSGFSKLCFLVKGRLTYAGSFHSVINYFSVLGYDVPTYENPSDYYMRIMQTDGQALIDGWTKYKSAYPTTPTPVPLANKGNASTSPTSAIMTAVSRIRSKERNTTITITTTITPQSSSTRSSSSSPTDSEASSNSRNDKQQQQEVIPWDVQGQWLLNPEARQEQPTSWQQYKVLLRRMLEDSYKDKRKMLSGIIMEGTIGLLIGLVWYQQDIHNQGSVFPVMGVFIMLTTIAIFDNCVSVGLKFPVIRSLHFREYSNGYYRLLPYYFATVTSSLVLSFIYQFIQAIIVFFLVGLHFTPVKFFVYLLVLSLAATIGAFLGFIVGTYTSDLKRTQEILTPLLMPMIIFSGYMLPLPQIPKYLKFVYYLSIYQYIFSTLVINHFTGIKFSDCSILNTFCNSEGEDYLKLLGLSPSDLPRDFIVIFAYLLVLILIGYLNLRRVSM